MTFPLISGAQAYPHLAILSFIREASLSLSKANYLLSLKLPFCLFPLQIQLKCVGYKETHK